MYTLEDSKLKPIEDGNVIIKGKKYKKAGVDRNGNTFVIDDDGYIFQVNEEDIEQENHFMSVLHLYSGDVVVLSNSMLCQYYGRYDDDDTELTLPPGLTAAKIKFENLDYYLAAYVEKNRSK